ncbi:MAG: hypothetical protein Kow0075_02900 [Salibacteraceae bacterium]
MKFLLPLSVLCISVGALAQVNIGYEYDNTTKVYHGTDELIHAWAGGLNTPQFGSLSLDTGLATAEAVVAYERDGGFIKVFAYDPISGAYRWIEDGRKYFPKLKPNAFMILEDYNQDGKKDLFTLSDELRYIALYKNTGQDITGFEKIANELYIKIPGLGPLVRFEVEPSTVPVIKDFDGDGDLDLMSYKYNYHGMGYFKACPSFVLIQNQSMENYGVADSLVFREYTKCWGKIAFKGPGNADWKNYSCDTNCHPPLNFGGRDVTLTQAAHDLDGNGGLDLILTYTHNSGLVVLYNEADNMNAYLNTSSPDPTFPSNDVPVEIENQPYPYFIDIDRDGNTDMLVASNQVNQLTLDIDTSQTINVDHYYRNVGSNTSPEFKLSSKGFFSGEMIDVGFRSFPAVGDLTGDGLPDLVIGNAGYLTYNATAPAKLAFYKNTGQINQPVYELVTADLAGLSTYGFHFIHPTLGDLDSDGDLDLIIGTEDGRIHYVKNKGSLLSPFFQLVSENYSGIKLDNEAHPQLVDLSTDGLPDLVIGDGHGKVRYFENKGTSTEPDFTSNPTIANMGNVNVHQLGGSATPQFTKRLDGTDTWYLLVGSASGRINVYGPVSSLIDDYELKDSLLIQATDVAPVAALLTTDENVDLIIGQRTGGLYFLKRKLPVKIGVHSPKNTSMLRLAPNPANAQIKATNPTERELDATIYDLSGRPVLHQLHLLPGENLIDLSMLASGCYLLGVTDGKNQRWIRFLKH